VIETGATRIWLIL